MFAQICSGMRYIHEHGLIHRDLNPSNIYLSHSGIIKIADFGLTTLEDPTVLLTDEVGTPGYIAPEMKARQPYNHKVDIYSLGVVFLELMVPCGTQSECQHVLAKIRQGILPVGYGQRTLRLLLKMLNNNPARRPEAQHILELLHRPKPQSTRYL